MSHGVLVLSFDYWYHDMSRQECDNYFCRAAIKMCLFHCISQEQNNAGLLPNLKLLYFVCNISWKSTIFGIKQLSKSHIYVQMFNDCLDTNASLIQKVTDFLYNFSFFNPKKMSQICLIQIDFSVIFKSVKRQRFQLSISGVRVLELSI